MIKLKQKKTMIHILRIQKKVRKEISVYTNRKLSRSRVLVESFLANSG
jgi:hypothetical protein